MKENKGKPYVENKWRQVEGYCKTNRAANLVSSPVPENGRNGVLFSYSSFNNCHNPTIFLPALLCIIRGNRGGFTIPYGSNPGCFGTEFLDKVFLDAFSPALRKLHVVVIRTNTVGMSFEFNIFIRVCFQEVC